MEFSPLLMSLGTSSVIFVVLMLLFTWLSRKSGNKVVYYPGRILRRLDPWDDRHRNRNPFAWIAEALWASEAEVVAAGGLDAAVYLVFLRSVLGILVFSSIILLPAHLLVSKTDHGVKTSHAITNGTLNNLDMLTTGIVKKESPRLSIFLLATYWVSFVTYYVVWKAYKHVFRLRMSSLRRREAKPEEFTVLIRDIFSVSQNQSLNEVVETYFKSLFPKTYYRSMIVTDTKEANKLWMELEGFKKKLSRVEVLFAKSKSMSNPDGIRPTKKTLFLGKIGKKVDTIDYYKAKIKELLPKLEAEQKTSLREKHKPAALVFFKSRLAAMYASCLRHHNVVEAPEPCQLLWSNLPTPIHERATREFIVYLVLYSALVYYMMSIVVIDAHTSTHNLMSLLPFSKTIMGQPGIKSALEAFLPQLALMMFMALLPKYLIILSKATGIPSQSHAVRLASKYLCCLVSVIFIGSIIQGELFNSLQTVFNDPEKILNSPEEIEGIIMLLGEKLCGTVNFFTTYVALNIFLGYGLELSRLVPLIMFHFKRKCFGKSDAELKDVWTPGDLDFATRVPNDILIVMIMLCYSLTHPLIIPFGVTYFGLGWLITRNQVLKVYTPSYESYGRMWPDMHVLILAALTIYQITMSAYIVLKNSNYVLFLVPLFAFALAYAPECKRILNTAFWSWNTSLDADCEFKEIPNLEAVYTAYIPPCLKLKNREDVDQFEDAQS